MKINPLFQFHNLNVDGLVRVNSIATLFTELLAELEKYAAPGREMSLVKTKLEEAAFFAKKAVAVDPSNTV